MNARASFAPQVGMDDEAAAWLEEFGEALRDPWWRLTSGHLYKIMTKDDEGQPSAVVPFIPNDAQLDLLGNLWHRNAIPKSRQLGITTAVCILFTDHAAFNADQRCGLVAHDLPSAQSIFRDKVRFAYRNLPDALRALMPLAKDAADELLFAHNNSSFRVAVSMRSGTLHRMHVSELAKLARHHPIRAEEVITGTLPAVPANGIAIVESTSQGPYGPFFDICKQARAARDQSKILTPKDYRLHFYGWWMDRKNRLDPTHVLMTPNDHAYFAAVEADTGIPLDLEQRAWYVATRDGGEFAGNADLMFQENPSTLDECWNQNLKGTYYAHELARARLQGRIARFPFVSHVPVNSFWDLGSNDGTGVWLHQHVAPWHTFLAYIEGWGESLAYFVRRMQEWAGDQGGVLWGRHFLPHDGEAERQMGTRVARPIDEFREIAPGWNFQIVPRVQEFGQGINRVRARFSVARFDEVGCKEGLAHLTLYSRRWNDKVGGWMDGPVKDVHTEAADAFRQWAQGWEDPTVTAGTRPKRSAVARRMP